MTEQIVSTVASRSLMRERTARKEAETLLEQKSRELYDINLNLRQLNSHLEESETRYRTLVELMPDAIWIHTGGKVVFMNPAAQQLFGASAPEQLLGCEAIGLIPEGFRAQMAQGIFGDLAAAQQQPRCALRVTRVDGSLVDVEFFGCAIRFNDAESVMNVAHDITERRPLLIASAKLAGVTSAVSSTLTARGYIAIYKFVEKPWRDEALLSVLASGFAHYESCKRGRVSRGCPVPWKRTYPPT